ncbi:MAG: SIR2 family protein [Roseiflexaceae bacterium]|nr:SIR2 family protein [Roseiflexaceae bacterium]
MTITTAIQEQLASSRLVLFLGADLPAALTSIPSRANLSAGLAQRHNLPSGLSLATASQRVIQRGNRFAFTDYLIRQLDTLGKPTQRIHQLIAQLSAPMIITTAYDNLLELAFQAAGEPINRVVRDSDLAFVDPRRHTLIKLYGDLQQRDTLIVTEDDQHGLWRNRDKENLLDEVRRAMRSNAVLFLGYDLTDPDFLLLWREVLDRVGRFALGAYAVNPGMAQDERRVWEDREVRVIDAEPLAFLEQLTAAGSGVLMDNRSSDAHQSIPPTPTAAALKRATLERRLASITEEFMVVNQQIDTTIDAAQKLRLERRAADLLAEIARTEAEI